MIENMHVFYAVYDTAMEHYRTAARTANVDVAITSMNIAHTLLSAIRKMTSTLDQPTYYVDGLVAARYRADQHIGKLFQTN